MKGKKRKEKRKRRHKEEKDKNVEALKGRRRGEEWTGEEEERGRPKG